VVICVWIPNPMHKQNATANFEMSDAKGYSQQSNARKKWEVRSHFEPVTENTLLSHARCKKNDATQHYVSCGPSKSSTFLASY